jgi:hypothetical protein
VVGGSRVCHFRNRLVDVLVDSIEIVPVADVSERGDGNERQTESDDSKGSFHGVFLEGILTRFLVCVEI